MEYKPLPGDPSDANRTEDKETRRTEVRKFLQSLSLVNFGLKLRKCITMQVPVPENAYWKELGLLVAVWISVLGLEISKVVYALVIILCTSD